tara:strand:+ start:1163 stop:2113 length:951 start_codon:yes stop_codon:yes gene_type:complete
MKFKKPKFWDYEKPNFFSYLLLPLSFILIIFSYLRTISTPKIKKLDIKTICIGNIYVGGTGKTSLSIKISNLLKEKKIKTCFIKKDYASQIDEQKILQNNGKLFKSLKRKNALHEAISNNYKVAIFDDGLQDPSLSYDLRFICFNTVNWIGNGLTIPAGPLREDLKNLKKYKHVFLIGNMENIENIKKIIFEINPQINVYVGKYKLLNLNEFNLQEKYIVFSGIGNHKTFISTLVKNKFNIVKDIEFPDHYNYSKKDISEIISISNQNNCKIITTEKDYNRLNKDYIDKIKFIKSDLEIIDQNNLLETLSKVYEQN